MLAFLVFLFLATELENLIWRAAKVRIERGEVVHKCNKTANVIIFVLIKRDQRMS